MQADTREERGTWVVVLAGEIDLEQSPKAREILLESVGRGLPVLVDLSAVEYIDSSGVASLVEALPKSARSRHRSLRLQLPARVYVGYWSSLVSIRCSGFATPWRRGSLAAPEVASSRILSGMESLGRSAGRGLEAVGFGASLFFQSAFWVVMGRKRRQPVKPRPIAFEMMEAGVRAIPIVSVLSITIGLMLAIQGINALQQFGAEHQVTFGVAISITREFAPLITGIVVAGRSGSALAARIGTMMISSEVDALRVMGISPVRFLVVPSLVAMLIVVPCLSLLADFLGLLGAGLYISGTLGMTLGVYADQVMAGFESERRDPRGS